MQETISDVSRTVRRVVRRTSGTYLPFLAGSLAYHLFLLLLPLLVLVFVVVSAVGGESTISYVVEFTQPYLTSRARLLLAEAIRSGANQASAVLLGTGVMGWLLFRIFRGLDLVFARIYGTETRDSIRGSLKDGAVTFVTVSLALFAAILAETVLALIPVSPLVRLLNSLLLVVVLAAAFFPLYYVFPNVEVTAREVLPGTIVAAVGWSFFHALFQVYTAYALTLEAYGAVGVVLSVLIWLYASAFILLLGAVVNAVLADRA